MDEENALQARVLGTSTVNSADALLLGVLNDVTANRISSGQIASSYQQALATDQKITAGVAGLALLTAVGVVVGPEIYAYCSANAASCANLVTEALDCVATVACTATAGGVLSAGAATKIAVELEQASAKSPVLVLPKSGKTSVYVSLSADGTQQYVGITDNLAARAAAHLKLKGIEIQPLDGLTGISRSDARAVEQVLIEYYELGKDGGTLINKINSIASINPVYAASLQRGKALLRSINYPGF